MKKIAWLLLLCGLNTMGQSIEKKDGTKIDVSGGRIFVEPGNKRLIYFEKDSKKAQRIKFKDLRQAAWKDTRFATFEVEGKPDGYYILAEHGGKKLLLHKRTRVKSRGGFESAYTRYALIAYDNAVRSSIVFTDENTDDNIAKRASVLSWIQANFPDCAKLTERTAAFESPQSDDKHRTVLVLLNEPVYVPCP